MSFHTSCEDIRIEVLPGDSTYLCAAGKDLDGNWHPNRLRLDDIIGNSDGMSMSIVLHISLNNSTTFTSRPFPETNHEKT